MNKVTNRQVEALREEAASAGDMAMVEICNRALGGDAEARQECGRVIAAAAAMGDAE